MTTSSRTATFAEHALPVEDGDLPLTIARAGGTGAAVCIMPSAFGVTADLLEQMAELAEHASSVVAIDPFFRGDGGPIPYEEQPRVMARLGALDRGRAYRDLRAAIEWLETDVILLGICFGGPYALMAAADGLIAGAVTWHGTRMEGYLDRARQIRVPLRLHFGSLDPIVPMSAVEEIRAAFAAHENASIVVHEGATHGFSHRAAKVFDPKAERAGMDAVRELLGAVFD